MSLVNMADPERDQSKFTSSQRQEARKLKEAWEKQGLPDNFSNVGVHIRREKSGNKVFISNNEDQICMLNKGRLDLYITCPKCKNMGFKNTIVHTPRCVETFGRSNIYS
jgi:hypothetical protein